MPDELPRLYTELASWFHLLTAPAEYVEEAEFFRRAFLEAADVPPRTLLELGSGGGNVASHYKRHFQSTLVDLSPPMLALSTTLMSEPLWLALAFVWFLKAEDAAAVDSASRARMAGARRALDHRGAECG